MKYIIWGAGTDGRDALHSLGSSRVAFFADKNKYGMDYLGKEVIPISQAIEKTKNEEGYVIVVASSVYQSEMEYTLKENGVKRYFIFSKDDLDCMDSLLPFYSIYGIKKKVYYNEILAPEKIERYHKIVIYGVNRLIPYLISEIMVQSPDADIAIAKQTVPPWEFNSLGIKTIDFDINSHDIDCLILNVRHNKDDIRNRFNKKDMSYKTIDIYDADELDPANQYDELKKFKNIHEGKRCFVVATGPSLTIEDLNTLHEHNEICISVNKIYRVYDRTEWRADYVGIGDPKALDDLDMDVSGMPGEWFIGDNTFHVDGRRKIPGINYFHFKLHGFLPFHPRFTEDFSRGTFWGGTITFDFGLQFAHYLGCSEVYVIGADNSFGSVTDKNNHFIPDYFTEKERGNKYVDYHVQEINLSYETSEAFARRNGFRIYNATRGGNLEAFERVDFDKLF